MSLAPRLAGSRSGLLSEAEQCYAIWNSLGSPEDHHDRAPSLQTLGVVNDGVAGRRDVPTECFGKMVLLVL